MKWPPVAVLIVTYDRIREITRTINALKEHLVYDGPLHWHLADDYSPEDYIHSVKRTFPSISFTNTVTERRGWGKNVNVAQRQLFKHHSFIFLCEDDYVARGEVNLNHGVALLQANRNIGLVRYDGIAAHSLNLKLREAKTKIGKLPHFVIIKQSPHLNLYSNRPHLKHKRFLDKYGEYPEGKRLGATEESFAHRVKTNYSAPGLIAVLTSGIHRGFDHIGKSYKGGKFDKIET